jgi:putative multiple sugar transport system ATP-binding protein
VRRGEVVGIAGLMGSGRTELAMSLFGKAYGRNIRGTVLKYGKPIEMQTPRDAIKHGLAYVTEDRKEYGLIMINDIKDNISLVALDALSSKSVINKGKVYQNTEILRGQMNIKTPNVFQTVGNLSGGNQQKVVLAKWIMSNPDLLILDEPTRGIDIGAKYEIYLIINGLAEKGKGIVMISSEMEELIGMCDRIYVLNEGEIKGELTKREVTQEAIMRCIVKSGVRVEKEQEYFQ